MKILLDNDVLLDVALNRNPHARDSVEVFRWIEASGGPAVGVVAWHSLTNCAYLLKGGGRSFLERLVEMVDIAPATAAHARQALALPMSDLEDAFQAAAAVAWGAQFIVTRNLSDYRRSPVPAVSPVQFLRRLR